MERGRDRERRRAAAAGSGEPGHMSPRGHLPMGRDRASGRLPHGLRGERLDQIFADPGEQDFAAETGGVVGADRDDGGSDLADFGELVNCARRVGNAVNVDDHESGGVPVGERLDGRPQPARPDLGIVAVGGRPLEMQQPFAQGILGLGIRREGKRGNGTLGHPFVRGGLRLRCAPPGVDFGKVSRECGNVRQVDRRRIVR